MRSNETVVVVAAAVTVLAGTKLTVSPAFNGIPTVAHELEL